MKTIEQDDNYRDLYRFTEQLHAPPADDTPIGMPDWQRAPPVYRPKAGTVALKLPRLRPDPAGPCASPLSLLGELLWLAYGCFTIRNMPAGLGAAIPSASHSTSAVQFLAARPVASGGGCYPGDINIVFGKEWDAWIPGLSQRIYRYGPQYHALFAVADCAATDAGLVIPAATEGGATVKIVLSVNFLRTWFKYRDFAYRLSAVDLGVLLGRLDSLTDSLRLDPEPQFNIANEQYDRILTLDRQTEASYAALTLRMPSFPSDDCSTEYVFVNTNPGGPGSAAAPVFSVPFRHMHSAAQRCCPVPDKVGRRLAPTPTVAPWALAQIIEEATPWRQSSASSFIPVSLPGSLLRRALALAHERVLGLVTRSDCDDVEPLQLYCTVINADGYQPGLYRYSPERNEIDLIKEGDFADMLQQAQYLANVHIRNTAAVVHVAAMPDWRRHRLGPRAYRVMQMLVGVALDSIMLAASGPCHAGHAFLGFATGQLDALYGLDKWGGGTMAQVCVGATRRRYQLTTSVCP